MDDKDGKNEFDVAFAVLTLTQTDTGEICPDCGEPIMELKATSGATSNAYRRGWDNIFGGKKEVGQA